LPVYLVLNKYITRHVKNSSLLETGVQFCFMSSTREGVGPVLKWCQHTVQLAYISCFSWKFTITLLSILARRKLCHCQSHVYAGCILFWSFRYASFILVFLNW